MSSKLEKKSTSTPFYEVPANVTTSTEIIEEARRSLRAIPIKRPNTPASGRYLFGTNSTTRIAGRTGRPPSVYNIGHGQYIEEPLQPSSGHILAPIHPAIPEVPLINSNTSLPISSKTPPFSQTIQDYHSDNIPITSQTHDDMPKLQSSQSSPSTSRRVISAGKRTELPEDLKRALSAGDVKSYKSQQKLKEKSQRGDSVAQTHADLPNTKSLPSTEKISVKSQVGQVWDTQIKPLLDALDPADTDLDQLCSSFDQLWVVLNSHNLLGKALGAKRRSALLKTVFQMLSHKEPGLLLKIAKIILGMEVTGSNLLNVCKLIFSLSREETNDSLFLKEEIVARLIDCLSQTNPHTHHEIMVYGLGSIKLLASNANIRKELSQKGGVIMLAECLQKCAEESHLLENKDTIADILVQLIAALRNLSDSGIVYDQFVSGRIPQNLSVALQQHSANTDVIFNASRLLSKLTLSDQCRHVVGETTLFLSLCPELMSTHVNNQDIIVRLCFILSNISSDNSQISYELCHTHSLLTSLDKILNNYLLQYNTDNKEEETGKITDVLIKSVSLLANLSVHLTVAPIISRNEERILQLLHILESVPISQSEELLITTLATLNNLSFYSQDENTILIYQEKIALILIDLLIPECQEVLLESIRVLGNLTRHTLVRTIVSEKRVDELLVTLLDSKHIDLVYATCGVLINLTSDKQHRTVLLKTNGVKKLLDVLSHFGRQDWLLAGLVCKVLWNYSEGLYNITTSFTDDEITMLYHLLEEYLDPVTAFTTYMIEEEEEENEDHTSNSTHQFWTADFVPVATNIVKQIQNMQSQLVPL